ncbi:MAG: molecular chaperone DnaJ [Alkalinema sp. CACIAM 70d]|nr:MAG: molecular chaperone DnaJ [Alkalinema sp. CACIAM 70d]
MKLEDQNPELYYQLLELEVGSSLEEIKQSYKDLAKVWHPDRFNDDPRLQLKAEEKFKHINIAYEFLKSHHPPTSAKSTGSYTGESNLEKSESNPISVTKPVVVKTSCLIDCQKLTKFLELGQLQNADAETKRLLLELTGREKDGWLRPEDISSLSSQSLSAIDQLWLQYSNGRFGFSVQRQIWQQLGCKSSNDIALQTLSENRFAQSLHWRKGNSWICPWDAFNDDMQAPLGSYPRAYIFALSGWQSYSRGWLGYLLWRFDELFLKV